MCGKLKNIGPYIGDFPEFGPNGPMVLRHRRHPYAA